MESLLRFILINLTKLKFCRKCEGEKRKEEGVLRDER